MRSSIVYRRKDGFTLIELLIVIAIIAVLAAILYPTVTSMIERGKRMQCSANLRAIAQAHYVFDGDNGAEFTPSASVIGNFPPEDSVFVQDKTLTPKQFLCPLDKGTRRQAPYPWGRAQPISPPWFSYSRNAYGMNPFLPVQVDLIAAPSQQVFFMEEWELAPMNDGYVYPNAWDLLTARHGGKGGMAFFDGHVEYINSETFNQSSSTWRIQNYFRP